MKSGYWFINRFNREEDIRVAEMRPSLNDLKNEVWKLKLLPKIKQFLWNVLSGAVPTYVQLCTRGINLDPTCQRCCYEEETINHALFKCPHAFAIWRCSDNPLVSQFSDNLEDNISLLFKLMDDLNENDDLRLQSFWTLWYVWKSRNEFIFNKRNVNPIEDARRAKEANEEWVLNVKRNGSNQERSSRPSTWEPPPLNWFKCNFDCS